MNHLLRNTTVAAAALAFAGTVWSGAASPQAEAKELKLAHFMSTKHPMDRFIMRPWSEDVAKMSAGGLTVKIFPGGALGKGPAAQFKRAVDGVADITFGLPGYTASLFRRTGIIELPDVAKSGPDGANKLWDAFAEISSDWSKVKVLALWVGEAQVLMTKNKPVRTVADIKGMKIRTPSKMQAEAIKALGGTPVPMPIIKVYNALNTGVIDAVLTGPSAIRSFKLGEVARYFTTGLPTGRSPFFLVMNRKSWDGLSDEQRALVDKTTGRALSVKASETYERLSKSALDSVGKTGRHEVIALPADEVKAGTALLLENRARLVAQMEKDGVPARKILAAMGVPSS